MMINVWRYSHFLLAVSSFLFLIIASVTGFVLSTQPVVEQMKPHTYNNLNSVTLSEFILTLQNNYEEILEVEVDDDNSVQLSSFEGEFYINPITTKQVAELEEKSKFYSWVKGLHRSLFLHKTGRIIVGVTSFLLFVMALTGLVLVLQRVRGFRNILKPIVKQNSNQYYHTVTGRLILIPILIISLTGTYLFLVELGFLPDQEAQTVIQEETKQPELKLSEFPIFKETKLSQVKKIEFPFSEDEEDVFILQLKNREVEVHQYTGQILAETETTFTKQLKEISMKLHTGRGNFIWAILLGLASLNILYFIYSGAMISWRRLSSKVKNKFTANEAEYIILVGSENGSTRKMASLLWSHLLNADKKAFIDDLNNYQTYPKASHLLLLTSTYGDGEAPSNANLFLEKLNKVEQKQPIITDIVGFGSYAYAKFNQFAKDIEQELRNKEQFLFHSELTLIHNQSFTAFKLFVENWSKREAVLLDFPDTLTKETVQHSILTVVKRDENYDAYSTTFVLELESEDPNYLSGDLLAVVPKGNENDTMERFYSMGVAENGNILLSIKLHEMGVCSSYLYGLQIGDTLQGRIQKNKEFHLPKKKPVIFIANGTGIAPFMGMMQQNKHQEKYLYFGDRNYDSFKLYNQVIEKARRENTLTNVQFALSRVEEQMSYVQELLEMDAELVANVLIKQKGTIMICGSLAMQKGVLEMLDTILKDQGKNINTYIARHKIVMDCY